MSKDTFYFQHDYNPRSDDKIKPLIRKFGMLGYGIFWSIVEDLYNNANALRTDYEGIAYDLRTDKETVKSVINDFDLFQISGDYFSSKSVEKRLNERNEKSLKASISAKKRWEKEETQCERIEKKCEGNAIKERKRKEIKEEEKKIIKKEIAPNVATKKNRPIEDRKTDFYNSLVNYVKKYSAPMIRDFFEYWTETDKKKEKMRFEDQKYFDVSRRLATWYKGNSKKFENGEIGGNNKKTINIGGLEAAVKAGIALHNANSE